MPWPLITQAQLENRLSATTVRRFLDDDKTGQPKAGAIAQLLLDASGKVAGALAPVYPIDVIRAMGHVGQPNPVPDEVVRITLDVAHAMLGQRHPEMNVDGFELMKQAERDMKQIRESHKNLGVVGPPEPPANTAAVVGYTSARGNNSFVR